MTIVFMRTNDEAIESVQCDLSERIHHSLNAIAQIVPGIRNTGVLSIFV